MMMEMGAQRSRRSEACLLYVQTVIVCVCTCACVLERERASKKYFNIFFTKKEEEERSSNF